MCDWNQTQLVDNLCDIFVMGPYNEHLLQQPKSLEDMFQDTLTFEAAEQELLKWTKERLPVQWMLSVNVTNQNLQKFQILNKGQSCIFESLPKPLGFTIWSGTVGCSLRVLHASTFINVLSNWNNLWTIVGNHLPNSEVAIFEMLEGIL